ICLAAVVGYRVEAADIEQQVEWSVHSNVGEPGHIADQQLCTGRFALRRAYRAGDIIDARYVPAVVEHVLGVRSRATAEVDRPTRLQRIGPPEQRAPLGRWNA